MGAGLVVVTVFFTTGLLDFLRDQQRVEDVLDGNGIWGPLAYVGGFTALQPLSLPGALLVVPATFVWPWWKVFILTMLGGVIASTIGFYLARWLGQDWVEKRLPDRLRPWQQRIEDNQFLSVFLLRLATGLAPPADWVLGVSPVSFRAFLLGTVTGLAPMVLVMSLWGDDAARFIDASPWVLLPAAVLAIVWARRRPQPDAA